MKGQYLAVEMVITIGMGLAIAAASISVFSDYRDRMMDTATEHQVTHINSEVTQHITTLRQVDSGEKNIELPEELGGTQYQVGLNNGLTVIRGAERYQNNMNGISTQYSLSGSVDGGPINIFKSGDEITMRED